jgi:hypothetical protein
MPIGNARRVGDRDEVVALLSLGPRPLCRWAQHGREGGNGYVDVGSPVRASIGAGRSMGPTPLGGRLGRANRRLDGMVTQCPVMSPARRLTSAVRLTSSNPTFGRVRGYGRCAPGSSFHLGEQSVRTCSRGHWTSADPIAHRGRRRRPSIRDGRPNVARLFGTGKRIGRLVRRVSASAKTGRALFRLAARPTRFRTQASQPGQPARSRPAEDLDRCRSLRSFRYLRHLVRVDQSQSRMRTPFSLSVMSPEAYTGLVGRLDGSDLPVLDVRAVQGGFDRIQPIIGNGGEQAAAGLGVVRERDELGGDAFAHR